LRHGCNVAAMIKIRTIQFTDYVIAQDPEEEPERLGAVEDHTAGEVVTWSVNGVERASFTYPELGAFMRTVATMEQAPGEVKLPVVAGPEALAQADAANAKAEERKKAKDGDARDPANPISEWVPALRVVQIYGPEGARQATKDGALEWRGLPVEVKVPRTKLPTLVVTCLGSEARCVPAEPTMPPPAVVHLPLPEGLETLLEGSGPSLTDVELAAIRARIEAASPGPWEWWTSNSFRRLSGPDGKDGGVLHAVVLRDGVPDVEVSEEDAALLAHARTDLPRLLGEVERLRKLAVQAVVDELNHTAENYATAFTMVPVEEPLTLGQRAVLEAADEWEQAQRSWAMGPGDGRQTLGERESVWKAKKAVKADALQRAVRALREAPAVVRIGEAPADAGPFGVLDVVEVMEGPEARRAAEAMGAAYLDAMPAAAKAELAAKVADLQRGWVPPERREAWKCSGGAPAVVPTFRVDPAMPPGTVRLESSGGGASSVTITNLAPDPGIPNGPFRGEVEAPLGSVTLYGDAAVEVLGRLRGLRVESVERVGPPSPGIEAVALDVVEVMDAPEAAQKLRAFCRAHLESMPASARGELVAKVAELSKSVPPPGRREQWEASRTAQASTERGEPTGIVQTSAPGGASGVLAVDELEGALAQLREKFGAEAVEADLQRRQADLDRLVRGDGPKTMELAETLFCAYNEQSPNPWKTWDGKDVPRWPALSAQVQEKWRAVARLALTAVEKTIKRERDAAADDVLDAAELED